MGDEDFIKRGAAYAAVMNNLSNSDALDAIAALPAAPSHPLADDARRALEADDVYGWINSLPAASSDEPGKEVMPVETNAHTRSATGPGVTAGAAPAQDARSANRVEYKDDGTLDEIVTDAGVVAELVEALRLADAALSGANMNMAVVEKKVKAALALIAHNTTEG